MAAGRSEAPPGAGGGVRAERRQITVLFCDIVDATAISQKLDPEDLLDLLREYRGMCERVFAAYGGSSAQFFGDGVVAYFGYPIAQEDGPVRAVRAGLALARELRAMAPRIEETRRIEFRCRIGIHTGSAVVGPQELAVGETPNLAARAQEAAPPGSVAVSEATQRLTKGFFALTDLGLQSLKGFSQPVRLYLVDSETRARTRLDVAATVLSPFVGRERELKVLEEVWQQARTGTGSPAVAALSGEPGIGKSRQIRELREGLVSAGATALECYCSPLTQSTALRPIVEMIERQLALGPETPAKQQLAQLAAELERAGVELDVGVPIIASLLSIPLEGAYQVPDLLPPKLREVTFKVLLDWLYGSTRRGPVLLVIEDLHWSDPSTIEFVGMLIKAESRPPGALMLVLTYRPDFEPPWDAARVRYISLTRLPPPDTELLLRGVAGGRPIPGNVADRILAKADGVPLYVEEIARAVLDSASAQPSSPAPVVIEIPSTIQDSLAARLDRLKGARRIAQLAATIGRTFRYDLLRAIADSEDAELSADLDRLVAAGLLFKRGEGKNTTYIFKHALIQDSAYESLLRKTRQEVHRRIATVISGSFPALAESQPELLAQHYAGAGMRREAIGHWAVAGQRAIARSAYAESIKSFTAAHDLVKAEPTSEERDRGEIEILSGLGLAFISVKGWSAQEVEDTYGRAHGISRRLGEIPIRVLFGMWAVYVVRGDRERIAELLPHMQNILSHSKDPNELLIANAMIGGRAFWSAEYASGIPILQRGTQLCDRRDPRKQAIELFSGYGYEGQLYPHLFLAWTNAVQGRNRAAAEGIREAIEIARATNHPYVMATALAFGAAVAHDLGDVEAAEQRGAELLQLALKQGFPFFLAFALSFTGWAAYKKGDLPGGIKQLTEAVGIYKAVGGYVVLAYYQSYLVEALIAAGRLDEALVTIDEALRVTAVNLDVFCEPELNRLRGEILALKGDPTAGEAAIRHAYELAERQQATLFQARAAASLARLMISKGKAAEARALVQRALGRLNPEERSREYVMLTELSQ